jgi:hypothetical protein
MISIQVPSALKLSAAARKEIRRANLFGVQLLDDRGQQGQASVRHRALGLSSASPQEYSILPGNRSLTPPKYIELTRSWCPLPSYTYLFLGCRQSHSCVGLLRPRQRFHVTEHLYDPRRTEPSSSSSLLLPSITFTTSPTESP